MDARELANHVNYLGMERAARKIVMKDKLAETENVALMTSLEVYEVLLEKYEVVMCESEAILLIEKNKIRDFNEMAVYLSR